ncbi:MAG: thioredoxin-disulfide reductase [Armatimonadota bacterium]
MHDTIVIGGGIAGCTAAMYAERYGLDVLMLEMVSPGGQVATATTIENYPGFPEGISGPELAERVHEQALEMGVEVQMAEAKNIREREGGGWIVETSAGDLETISVIIATGAVPRSLKVPGEEELRGKGVSYCATCDGFFYRDQTVAVVGGGNTAIEEAMYLANIAEKVYVIHRRDELRAEEYLAKRVLDHEKIDILWNTVVTAVNGKDAVETLTLENTVTGDSRMVDVDGVFIAIGHVAKTEWLEDLLELEGGFIITDERMQTSQPGIFACGDIRNTVLRQIATAVGDAAIAAYAAHTYVDSMKPEIAQESATA